MKPELVKRGSRFAPATTMLLLCMSLGFAGCGAITTRQPDVTPAFAQRPPQSIEVRIWRAEGIDVDASDFVRERVESGLVQRGYSVQSVADARMEIAIESWFRQAQPSWGAATPIVTLDAFLYDCATGAVLWRAFARSSEEPDEDEDEDWLLALFDWVADEALESWTHDTQDVAKDAVRQLLSGLPSRERALSQAVPN